MSGSRTYDAPSPVPDPADGSSSTRRIVALHVAPASRMAMRAVPSIVLRTGGGIIGDRYEHSRHRHVSIQNVHQLVEASEVLGSTIDPGSTRRNVTIDGAPLPITPGTRVRLGADATIEVVRQASPCKILDDAVAPGAHRALRRRGGVIGRVLVGGEVRVDDRVEVLGHEIDDLERPGPDSTPGGERLASGPVDLPPEGPDVTHGGPRATAPGNFAPASNPVHLPVADDPYLPGMQTTEQAEDHPHGDTTGALPSIFVVGFPKAGTTTLHRLLVDAGARSATVKEPSVLLVDDAHGADLVAAYERYYPGASGRRHGPAIDASPYYVYDARAIDRLCALGSATHVLVCVREPWSRLVSQFKDQALQGFERRSLLGALVDELRVPVPVLDAAPRSISRSYLATTTYLPHLDRLLDSPLGPTVRLVAAESLDDEETRAALRRHTGLPVGAETVHANRARAGASLAPMLVDRVSAGVGSVVPAWLHRRVAPVAKPVLARAARLPIPGRMPAPVEVPAAIRDAAMARLAPTVEGLAALDADRWLGPRPDWVVRSG